MPRLTSWCFTNGTCAPKKPEVDLEGNEIEQTRLVGYVYDDSRYNPNHLIGGGAFENGHRVITSPIREVNLEEGYVITRSGTKYDLEGPMNEEYASWLDGGEEKNVFDMVPKLPN